MHNAGINFLSDDPATTQHHGRIDLNSDDEDE